MDHDAATIAEIKIHADLLLSSMRTAVHVRIDRLFILLMVAQWIIAMAVAFCLSPSTTSTAHLPPGTHLCTAIFVGGAILCLPVYMVATRPGHEATRQIIAIAQMMFSGLFIFLCGGRIEAHFHVFISLTLLAFYRDWKVLLTATLVMMADHWLRGWLCPVSLYGSDKVQPLRWVEHSAWIIYLDLFLVVKCLLSNKDMRIAAEKRAELEYSKALIEKQYHELKEQKAAEKRISEFCSTVSHELRTPLTSIRAALGMIDSGIIDVQTDEAKDLIAIAHASSVRLVRLINDILDLRKIETGALVLDFNEQRCNQLLDESVKCMAAIAGLKNIKLRFASCPDFVRGDHDRLIQVLTNLISNAVKFSPENSTIFVEAQTQNPDFVRFTVKDSGPGIPLNEQHKLFGRFQQVDSSNSRPTEGSGLGLAISKAIVEEHKGRIGFTSHEGAGATFWFEIPRMERISQPIHEEPVPVNTLVLNLEEDLVTRRLLQKVYSGLELDENEQEILTASLSKHMNKENASTDGLGLAVRDLLGTVAPSENPHKEQVA